MDISEKSNRSYTNGEITVYWQPKLCIHAGECFTQLPNVFKPQHRPWVDLSAASTEEIISTVNACPTDALTYKYNRDLKGYENKKEAPVKISYSENGPYIIKGDIELIDSHGNLKETKKTTALCSCGKSKRKPYCDGSHI